MNVRALLGRGRAWWAVIFCCLLPSVPGQARDPQTRLHVVATFPSLATIVHEVGGSLVKVDSLSAEQGDPHYVDAQPQLMLPLNRADLLVANGLELELGWLPPLQKNARNPRIQAGAPGFVEAAQFVHVLEVPQVRIDRSMGDLHPGGNPHFLNSPAEVARIAHGVARQLALLDPDHADAFCANAKVFADALGELESRVRAKFMALPAERRRVIAYHKSLAYLFAWLGLEEAATLEPQPGIAPTPKHVVSVLRSMRARQVRLIVQEAYYPSHNSRNLAKMAPAQLVVIPGNVNFRRHQSYLTFLEQIADSLYAALTAEGGGRAVGPAGSPAGSSGVPAEAGDGGR